MTNESSKLIEVKPSGLCSMCWRGTTKFSTCSTCGIQNCWHLRREHEAKCKAANPDYILSNEAEFDRINMTGKYEHPVE